MLGKNIDRILDVFHSVSWFSEVGKTLSIESDFVRKIEVCVSWDEAVDEINRKSWKNLKNDVENDLSSLLDQNHRTD